MSRVVGIGAGGHARVALEAIRAATVHEVVAFVDRDEGLWGTRIDGVPVVGGDDELVSLLESGVTSAFIGIGSVGPRSARRARYEDAAGKGFELITVVHPAAVVSPSAEVGRGCLIFAGAVVNAGARIGRNVIVNTGAVVEHDCRIADHAHVATGARLAGNVEVGAGAHIGIGAAIREGTMIGADALVGAGAVVVSDVPAGSTVVGVPAREMEKSDG